MINPFTYLVPARKPQQAVADSRSLTERTLDTRKAQHNDFTRYRDQLLVRQQQIETELYHAEVNIRSLEAAMDILVDAVRKQEADFAEEINRSFEEQLSEPGQMQPYTA